MALFPLSQLLNSLKTAFNVSVKDSLPEGTAIVGKFVPVDADGDEKFTATNPASVQLTGSITGVSASDTIARPNDTTAYTALDVVSTVAGGMLEFANLGDAGDLVVILGARLSCAVNAVPSGCTGYRLHLYSTAPTAIADNAVYNLPSTDLAKYLGYITTSTPIDLGDNIFSEDDNLNFTAKLAGTSLFGILQTIGAYTPTASAVKTITLNTAGV